jgi:hypothetical protein
VMTDQNPYRPSGSSGAALPDRPFGSVPVVDRKRDRTDETPAVRDGTTTGPVSASLVGSLAVFSLSDVLSLLASTAQTGELEVVGEGVEGRLWLDCGQLSDAQVGETTNIVRAVFELACALDGWFTYVAGTVPSSVQPGVAVEAVLDEVRPQVEEWREIRDVVPLESLVSLSPTPPGKDVQIRGDQWQVLAAVGTNGLSVREVLDQTGGEQIVGLRTLRDLHVAGLIVLRAPETRDGVGPRPVEIVTDSEAVTVLPTPPFGARQEDDAIDTDGVPPPPQSTEPAVASREGRQDGLAEVTIMPPPIAGDPWTPVTEPHDTGSGIA